MLHLLVFIKLLLFGLLLEQSYGNIEDDASKKKIPAFVTNKIFHTWLFFVWRRSELKNSVWILPNPQHFIKVPTTIAVTCCRIHEKTEMKNHHFWRRLSPPCGCTARETFFSLRLYFTDGRVFYVKLYFSSFYS